MPQWAEDGSCAWPDVLGDAWDKALAKHDKRTANILGQVIASLHHGFYFSSFAEDDEEKRAQCALIRDVYGYLFWRVKVDPAWRVWHGGTVLKLAQTIYDDCAFERLPVLGDALEDAGCDHAGILAHCREPGEHVRGCWVLDLLLGKQ